MNPTLAAAAAVAPQTFGIGLLVALLAGVAIGVAIADRLRYHAYQAQAAGWHLMYRLGQVALVVIVVAVLGLILGWWHLPTSHPTTTHTGVAK